jgi:zinc/manganese transport system permease protein
MPSVSSVLHTMQLWWLPLTACLVLPGLLVYLGLHIVRREIIFVDLALAQVAALGSSLGILLHLEPETGANYALSLGFTLVGAALFTFTRSKHHRVPQEALIGIVYVVAAALGILLLSQNTEGNEELKRSLIGDVLVMKPGEFWRALILYGVAATVHFVFRRKFLALSFHPENATGMSLRLWDFFFYAIFGWVVTSFVRIGGVLLVFSYLIIPAVSANYLVRGVGALMVTGWIISTLASVVGFTCCCVFDFPIAPAIVCTLAACLILSMAYGLWIKRSTGTAPR